MHLLGQYLIFMTKTLTNSLVFISLLISSCASYAPSIDLGYFRYWQEGFAGNSIDVDDQYINSMDYSFIKIKQGRNEAIFVLSTIDENGYESWVGLDNNRIVTFNGLIVRTSGLDTDFNFEGFASNEWSINFVDGENYSGSISLSSPRLYRANATFQHIKSQATKDCDIFHTFSRNYKDVGFHSSDTYCFSNGAIKSSSQRLSPFSKTLEIYFYYKY
jgi:hypothetical protein